MTDDVIVKDSNGAVLKDGDSVTLTKDLKVKGANTTLKRGTLVKGIRLTEQPSGSRVQHQAGQGTGSAHRISQEGVAA